MCSALFLLLFLLKNANISHVNFFSCNIFFLFAPFLPPAYLEVSSSHALIFLLVVRVNDSYKQDISKSPKITVLGPLFAFYGQPVCVSKIWTNCITCAKQ